MEEVMLVNPKGAGLVPYAKSAFKGENMIGGAFGLFATLTVPKLIKWDGGWKGIIASGATTVIGGWALTKYNKSVGYAFTTVGAAVTALRAIRWILGGFSGTLGIDYSESEDIGDLADLGEFGLGQEDDFEEEDEDLFGTDALEPTFESL